MTLIDRFGKILVRKRNTQMAKILHIIVESIIWFMLFKLITLIPGMTEITLLPGVCAFLLAKMNYIENKTRDN